MEATYLEVFLQGDIAAVQRALDTLADRKQRGESRVLHRRGPEGGILLVPLDMPEEEAAGYLERAEQICEGIGVHLSDRLEGPPLLELLESWRRRRAARHLPADRLDFTDAELGGARTEIAEHDVDLFEVVDYGRPRAWTTQRVVGAALGAAMLAAWLWRWLWSGD